ncbi:hypothetical protein KY285_033626 [Solanum tuberosum]|nr:hypothetical protein KY285_033626 [Solanum tuberosum]
MTYVWADTVVLGFTAGFSGLPRFLREEDGMGSGVAAFLRICRIDATVGEDGGVGSFWTSAHVC